MPRKLNIAFFGSSLVSAYWNGAATYYRGIIRALHRLGHRVCFYEPDAYGRQEHRDISDPEWAEIRVYPAVEDEVFKALESAKKSDLVIKASGVGVFDALLERNVLDLKGPRTRVLFWDVDAPATLDRLERCEDPFRRLVPQYDIILTYGGGEPVRAGYKSFGARECIPVYNALDPSTHFRVSPEPHFAGSFGFLGNRLPDREERVDEFFFRPASSRPGTGCLLGGNGWGDKKMPTNVRYLGHVYTADHNVFNSSLEAVLNVSRESMARYGFSPATRVFEAAGAGACIITDAWKGVELFLDPGREILIASSGDEVAAHLDGLTRDKSREIGNAALKRVLAEHTYGHRAEQLERIFEVLVT